MLKLHLTYGPIVRVAPDILAYNHPDAIKEIRGYGKGGRPEHRKDPHRYGPNFNNIIGADRPNHIRYRRALGNGFSHQALVNQQSTIEKHVDLLFRRLTEMAGSGAGELDLVKWFNYTTFDIIGELTFGESFGCLESSTDHPLLAIVFDGIKYRCYNSVVSRFPILYPLLSRAIVPKDLKHKLHTCQKLLVALVRKRMDVVSAKQDFMATMMAKRDDANVGHFSSYKLFLAN